MAVVFDKASAEYETVLSQVHNTQGISLSMINFKYANNNQWQLLSNKILKKGYKLSLLPLNGTYYKCGESGHKANECPNKSSTDKGRGKFKNFWENATIAVKLAINNMTVGKSKRKNRKCLLVIISQVRKEFQLQIMMTSLLS